MSLLLLDLLCPQGEWTWSPWNELLSIYLRKVSRGDLRAQHEYSISWSRVASRAPTCRQCPVTCRMTSLPTLGIGAMAFHTDHNGGWCPDTVPMCSHDSCSQPPSGEGAFMTPCFCELNTEEGEVLPESHSVLCRQGGTPPSLRTP